MNCFNAFTVHHVFHCHAPMLRLPGDAEPKPILKEVGEPAFFKTRERALDEALKHLLAYVNGDLRRDGITLSDNPRAAANALFKPKEVAHG